MESNQANQLVLEKSVKTVFLLKQERSRDELQSINSNIP